jgi:alpha-L-arabinofuranosidase
MTRQTTLVGLLLLVIAPMLRAQESRITVHADRELHRLSPYLTGACIEDVNHEIYGGLYSQMIFGESFQEPPPPPPLKGLRAYGGQWRPAEGALDAAAGDGPKLLVEGPDLADGEVQVDLMLPEPGGGNAGLILKVRDPGLGADRFTGYEVSLDSSGRLVLGRHRQSWEPIRNVPVEVPVGQWVKLAVRMTGATLEVRVGDRVVTTYEDREHRLAPGRVGLRTWQRPARYRDLRITPAAGESRTIAFERVDSNTSNDGVSGMWRPVRRGTASGEFAIETNDPFTGTQCQRLTFRVGDGAIGVENQGLNRWGMNFVAGKPYEGHLWLRAERPSDVQVALESRDGQKAYASATVKAPAGGWSRVPFTLVPDSGDMAGRFAVTLKAPGSVVVGHAFLQPGEWGRFKGLPDRRDVTEALVDQGLTVLRYGGSMINHPAYRWKNMIGPRDRRPPTAGTWYPYSSNGWGIFDFLDFCEAAGFLAIPAVNVDETPQDMADFIAYANGPADSEWGRKRAADGHPAPYRLKYLEFGNEEAVNDVYFEKFRAVAERLWASDPDLVLIVGDFAYGREIIDPFRFEGGASVSTLAAHQKVLELAKRHDREVWFDIHISTDHPPEPRGLRAERSYIEQLGRLCPGAKHKVVIFEFNAGNHAQRRALANACAINEVQRLGERVPIACSANCLQPDGQNDNGWDQGLLFLNPSKVWLQPPGHVTRMVARYDQTRLLATDVVGELDVTATRSDDGKKLTLKVVNVSDRPQPARLVLDGFTPARPDVEVVTLAGPLGARNTAADPERIEPVTTSWRPNFEVTGAVYEFPAHSFSLMRLE